MKLISWNVNGLRACMQKGFLDFFQETDADIFCLQETKLQEGQIALDLPGYHQYWNYAEKKGYSGTAIFTKEEPIQVTYGIGVEEHDHEGRVITAEYSEFYFVTVYVPNAQRELTRLEYRMQWEADFLAYLKKLEEKKPVIYAGDLNVAHQEIDLKNAKTNRGNAGFTVMGNRVCAVVLSDTTGDRNQSDSGQIAVCGDRDDVRAADSRSGQSWLCRGQRYEGYRRCPAAGV